MRGLLEGEPFVCVPCNCVGNACRNEPYLKGCGDCKLEWPEVVGWKEDLAKTKILRDNPLVMVIPIYKGQFGLPPYCSDRVYLFVDKPGGVVLRVPMVG